jgi:hypothetical protein
MPAPLGKPPRTKNFLLRMDTKEDAFVRALARSQGTSLNDAITQLIRDRMARYGEPPPRAAPPRPGSPSGLSGIAKAVSELPSVVKTVSEPPAKPKRRRSPADLSDPTDIPPGQMDITDPDQ